MRATLRLTLALLGPLLALASLTCSGATYLADGYALRVWQTDDGLPQNLVTSAAQTRDGHLWFGTDSGLARFDGERFETFTPINTPGLGDRRISRLFEDANGVLWIGHDNGAITRREAGHFETVHASSGGENDKIIGLGADNTGTVWAMRDHGALDNVHSGQRVPSLLGGTRPGYMTWTRGDDGNIWVIENDKVARFHDGQLTVLPLEAAGGGGHANAVATSPRGGVWILSEGRVRKWMGSGWADDRGQFPWATDSIGACLELHDGTLAVGTIHYGLYLVFNDGRPPARFDRSNGLPQNWVRFLFEDREKTLWAGAGSAGLVSIQTSPFALLDAPDQRRGCTVTAVSPDGQNGLWFGTDGAGLYHVRDGKWTRYGAEQGLANPYIQAVTTTPSGDVWAGFFWWGSPYRLADGRFAPPSVIDPRWSAALALVPGAKTGELLVGNREGVLRIEEQHAEWLVKSPLGVTDDVSAIAIDRAGVIWAGFTRGGLVRIEGDRTTRFTRSDGLASDAVQCLLLDHDGSVWIGTVDNGLSRYRDGRFTHITRVQGLADNSICYIMDDGFDHYWLSTRRGLQRIAKVELNRCADGAQPTISGTTYDRNDGLPVVEFTAGRQGAGCRTPDGKLWFANSQGVLSVDPTRVSSNPLPPPVMIESVLVDGQRATHAKDARNAFAPDHERLEFRYSGLSFAAPHKVQFKYRMDGIDRDWIDAGAKRTAFYSRLPAGEYCFRVIACNNDGVWNTEGASYRFTIKPFVWQTWWFIGLSLIAAAASIAWFARFITSRRMRRKIEQMEREQEIERERARIAQDIHDDVGASLSRIAMLSQPGQGELAEPARASAMLSHIYTTAREVTRSLDEIVWAVDPRHDTLDSLVDYMSRYAQSFLTSAHLKCRLDVPVDVPGWPLTAEIRHNVFLSFKEALNNAAKHSGADEVRFVCRTGEESFRLEVCDNGRGLAQPPSETADRISSGRGLANLRERLLRIGGKCEITSDPGGTRVAFIIQMKAAGANGAATTPQS